MTAVHDFEFFADPAMITGGYDRVLEILRDAPLILLACPSSKGWIWVICRRHLAPTSTLCRPFKRQIPFPKCRPSAIPAAVDQLTSFRQSCTIDDDWVAAVIEQTLRTTLADAPHRSMAAEAGFSYTTSCGLWNAVRLRPYRYQTFNHQATRCSQCSTSPRSNGSARKPSRPYMANFKST